MAKKTTSDGRVFRSAEVRAKVLAESDEEELSVVAKRHGIPVGTISNWRAQRSKNAKAKPKAASGAARKNGAARRSNGVRVHLPVAAHGTSLGTLETQLEQALEQVRAINAAFRNVFGG